MNVTKEITLADVNLEVLHGVTIKSITATATNDGTGFLTIKHDQNVTQLNNFYTCGLQYEIVQDLLDNIPTVLLGEFSKMDISDGLETEQGMWVTNDFESAYFIDEEQVMKLF